jgi:hypothetical protein
VERIVAVGADQAWTHRALLVVTLVALATMAQPAGRAVGGSIVAARRCPSFLLGPSPEDRIHALHASGVGCRTAHKVAAASCANPPAPFDVHARYKTKGFSCRGRLKSPPGGGKGAIHFRCQRARATVTFIHD